MTDRPRFALLDELVSSGVLVGSEGRYRFAEESLREALVRSVSEERRRQQQLHRTIGRALLLLDDATTFRTPWTRNGLVFAPRR